MLGRKQRTSHEDFVAALASIEATVPRAELDALVARTAEAIWRKANAGRIAYGWSGGKDSIALRFVCELAGVHECVLVMSELEYPAFLRWVTDNMPPRLEVISTGQDIEWLKRNPLMLFPKTSAVAGKWFAWVQHTGQGHYYRTRKLQHLVVGRRKSDGNFVGPDGVYESKGVRRFSPLADWRHEDVLALIHYHQLPVPPCYGWPRGYRVGTGPWPARQWCTSDAHGWSEVYAIDPEVVTGAARAGFEPARRWLEQR
jgi:3'-phosphoadenosine 5'-phosphosulfate sulfotransferase (PAPS reductase)/FAD synthetase